jgi:hypothetical protein
MAATAAPPGSLPLVAVPARSEAGTGGAGRVDVGWPRAAAMAAIYSTPIFHCHRRCWQEVRHGCLTGGESGGGDSLWAWAAECAAAAAADVGPPAAAAAAATAAPPGSHWWCRQEERWAEMRGCAARRGRNEGCQVEGGQQAVLGTGATPLSPHMYSSLRSGAAGWGQQRQQWRVLGLQPTAAAAVAAVAMEGCGGKGCCARREGAEGVVCVVCPGCVASGSEAGLLCGSQGWGRAGGGGGGECHPPQNRPAS